MNGKSIYKSDNFEVFESGFVAVDKDFIIYPKDIIKELAAELIDLKEENKKLKAGLQKITFISEKCNYSMEKLFIDKIITDYYKTIKAIGEIKEIVSEPCMPDENCFTCNSNCPAKDILNIIKSTEDCIKEQWKNGEN